MSHDPIARLTRFFTQLISETSGLSLEDTLSLAQQSPLILADGELAEAIRDFRERLGRFRLNAAQIETLFEHPVSLALEAFLRAFPIPYRDAAVHMASRLYRTANVGALRLKFTLFRETSDPTEQLPVDLSPEDVLLGLYEGFRSFQSEMPSFKFILSPSFRKEPSFYERSSFDDQVRQIVELLKLLPELQD